MFDMSPAVLNQGLREVNYPIIRQVDHLDIFPSRGVSQEWKQFRRARLGNRGRKAVVVLISQNRNSRLIADAISLSGCQAIETTRFLAYAFFSKFPSRASSSLILLPRPLIRLICIKSCKNCFRGTAGLPPT